MFRVDIATTMIVFGEKIEQQEKHLALAFRVLRFGRRGAHVSLVGVARYGLLSRARAFSTCVFKPTSTRMLKTFTTLIT
jgi:hypothetical protein